MPVRCEASYAVPATTSLNAIPPRSVGRRIALFALTVALVVGAGVPAAFTDRPPEADELFYLAFARNIATHGVFGPPAAPGARPAPGADVAPLYPALLAVALVLDGDFAGATNCVLDEPAPARKCASGFAGPRLAQLAFHGLCAGLAALWLLSLTGRPGLVLLAMACFVLSGTSAEFASRFLTESLYFPLSLLFLLAFARLAAGGRPRWAVASGALLGLLALTRPTFLYLALMLVPLVPWVVRQAATGVRSRLLLATLFAAGTGLVVAGWMVRNVVVLDHAGLTQSYGSRALSTRLAYNAMRSDEYLAGWVYWLPDFGDKLAVELFGADRVRRLDLGHPDGFYDQGRRQVRAELAAATGVDLETRDRYAQDPSLGWLVREKIIGDFPRHVAVTLLLAWRGAFVAKYFGLLGLLAIGVVLLRRSSPERGVLVACLGPAVLLLFFNAFVSLNIPRYNLLLVLPMSVAMAIVVADALRRARCRRRVCDSDETDRRAEA